MNDVMQTLVADTSDHDQGLNLANEAPEAMTTGGRLSASRQSKKWSVQFVAEQLKLSQAQILALESNNFEALPKMVIVRGFVRAYAKLLKIDSDSLVALLPKDLAPVQLESSLRPALSTPFIESRLSLLGQHDNNRRYIIGAVVLVFVVAIFLLFQATEFGQSLRAIFTKKDVVVAEADALSVSQEAALKNAASVVVQPVTDTLEAPATAPILDATTILPETSEALASKSVESTKAVAETSLSVSPVTDVVSAPSPSPSPSPSRVNLPASTELFVLKFRQDSWVQVKTEAGTVLSSHLAKAGSEESFGVAQALYVKLGNAAGVDAVLRGVPMAVSSERGNNVANIIVK